MLIKIKDALIVIFCILSLCVLQVSNTVNKIQNQDRAYWYNVAREILEKRIDKGRFREERPIKNAVFFIGDGMGLSTITAARILKGQNEGRAGEEDDLVWDTFPSIALSKTYNADAQIGESSACATALMCGVKANYETLGVDATIKYGECPGSFQGKVPSILSWAHQYGKQTGIVTTTRITHATPAALYAHSASRFWEDDSKIDVSARTVCKDIARQLVEDEPGNSIKVILGGGRRHFTSIATLDPDSPHKEGRRLDGRNLVEDWLRIKQRNKYNATYVTNTEQLRAVDVTKTDYLFGLFSHSHMDFDSERDTTPKGDPSLAEMTVKAIQMLKPSQHGYFLMVEGGRIDHGHHFNNAFRALDETLSLERAVVAALELVNLTDTLVVVTADHSHVMVLGGYSTPRGNSIFGYDRTASDVEDKAYTTLLYSNGPGGIMFKSKEEREAKDVLQRHKNTIQRAAVPRTWATHAGEDVPVYAIGHMSSELFRGTVDQTFIPHAIAYGSCMGPYASNCKETKAATNMEKPLPLMTKSTRDNLTSISQKQALHRPLFFIKTKHLNKNQAINVGHGYYLYLYIFVLFSAL